jgi:hypothetical protein
VLASAGGLALEAGSKVLPASDPIGQALLVIASTALAARRLISWRDGHLQPLHVRSVTQTIAILAGVAPWFVLPLLHAYSSLAPGAIVPGVRLAGTALILAAVAGPFWRAGGRGQTPTGNAPGSALDGERHAVTDDCTHAGGILLLTLNPFVAILALAGLVVKGRLHGNTSPELVDELDRAAA